jgi:hypothetical protein
MVAPHCACGQISGELIFIGPVNVIHSAQRLPQRRTNQEQGKSHFIRCHDINGKNNTKERIASL